MTSVGDWRLKMKLESRKKSQMKADIMQIIKTLCACFTDPVLTGAVSTLGIFKGTFLYLFIYVCLVDFIPSLYLLFIYFIPFRPCSLPQLFRHCSVPSFTVITLGDKSVVKL